MTIGLCTLEFHLPACRSLKEKRMFLKSLSSRLTNRHNVSVSEVDYQDLWQRSLIGVVAIGTSRKTLDRMFQKILREVEERADGELISFEMEFL